MKKTVSVFLALCMLFSLFSTCYAAEGNFLDDPIVLGTLEDDEGFYKSCTEPVHTPVVTTGNSVTLFSMKATSVQQLLTTYYSSGKNFTKYSLDYDVIGISGSFSFSKTTSTDYEIKVGVCYYTPNTGEYSTSSSLSDYWENGTESTSEILKLSLSLGRTYYGFVKNEYYSAAGTISGNATFTNYDL